MRISHLVVAAALACGCQKAKDSPSNAASGAPPPSPPPSNDTSADRGAGGPAHAQPLPPEPVAKDPAPPPSADTVRPPVAADLAEYTKDLPGSGPLVATIETTLGTFHCTLYGDQAPLTVANFVGLATGKKAWQDPSSGATVKGKPFFDG